MARAIELIGDRALTECSGNITRDNVQTYIDLGVDFISSGALTHSAGILDLSIGSRIIASSMFAALLTERFKSAVQRDRWKLRLQKEAR